MKYATMIISLLICMLSTNAQVTLYSDINYGGAAVSFPVGNYRLADMNAAGFPDDAVSSFQYPQGIRLPFLQMIILPVKALVLQLLQHGSVQNGMTR